MICPKCGNYAADTANYCVYCGTLAKSAGEGSRETALPLEPQEGTDTATGVTPLDSSQEEKKTNDYAMFMPGYKAAHEPPPAKSNFWLGFVLGLFAWIAAIVLYVIWKEDTPKKAAKMGKGAIIGAVIQLIMVILTSILYAAFIFSAY